MRTGEKDRTRAAWTSAAGATSAAAGGALTRDRNAAPPRETAAGSAVLAPALDPDAEPRGNLWRYAKWKFRDFMRERGSWMLALGGLGVVMFRLTYRAQFSRTHDTLASIAQEEHYFQLQAVGRLALMAFVGVLIATHGLVSRDRERGFQRFLFAKPVRATRYYLQSFFLNGAGFLAVLGFLAVCTMAAFARGLPLASGMLLGAASYAAIGGAVFLVSTIARYDFAIVLAGVMAATIIGNASSVRYEWGVLGELLVWLLPPVDSLGHAVELINREHRLADVARLLAWPFIYGAACVAAAVAIIRRRSIAN